MGAERLSACPVCRSANCRSSSPAASVRRRALDAPAVVGRQPAPVLGRLRRRDGDLVPRPARLHGHGELIRQDRSWVQWHTMFSLCGGIGPVVALLARPHPGHASSYAVATTAVDLVSYAMLLGFSSFAYFIMVPSVVPAAGSAPQSRAAGAGPGAAAAPAGGPRWRRSGSRARPRGVDTFARLAVGAAIGFVLRLGTSGAIARGALPAKARFYDLAWIVPVAVLPVGRVLAPASSGGSPPSVPEAPAAIALLRRPRCC